MTFDRKTYFDAVRAGLFGGKLTQQQVDGQEAILGEWEYQSAMTDLRWLAYMLATTKHETASTMWPIEEYGKGSGKEYGQPDPQTGQRYYGRGFVQLTWKNNYAAATGKLGLTGGDDLVRYPDRALDPQIASDIMFKGMAEGWFRSDSKGRQTLERYFNASVDDSYTAREIINGDKKTVPGWSNGVSIGNIIKDYHGKFLSALKAAAAVQPQPEPEPAPAPEPTPEPPLVSVGINVPAGTRVALYINGEQVLQAEAIEGP